MRVSDRRVSCGFLMRLTIGLILTCARRLSAATCQNSQKGVFKDRSTVNNERALLASKQSGNHDIHGQINNYTHVAIQVQAFKRKPKRLRLLAIIKTLKASTEVKETASVIKSCKKTFAET